MLHCVTILYHKKIEAQNAEAVHENHTAVCTATFFFFLFFLNDFFGLLMIEQWRETGNRAERGGITHTARAGQLQQDYSLCMWGVCLTHCATDRPVQPPLAEIILLLQPSFSCQTDGLTFDSRILGYTEELMVTARCQGPVAVKQAQIISPPPPCLTVGMRCLC